MSDTRDVKAPCLVCGVDAESPDGPLPFCPEHLARAGRIVAMTHPLKVLLLSAMEITTTDSDAATMLQRLLPPTTISHERCLELDAMLPPDRWASLATEHGVDALRLAVTLYDHERGSWIPADYMSAGVSA